MKKMRLLIVLLGICGIAMSHTPAVKVTLSDPDSFSMVIVPDIQVYVKNDINQPALELMTAWIAAHTGKLDMRTVLFTGDLVDYNNVTVPDGVSGNQSSNEQWAYVSHALKRLDNKVPYICCTGNHDYGFRSSEYRQSNFGQYFPFERNPCWRDCLVSVYNDNKTKPTLENAAYAFDTETWGKLLVLSLEFAPRDEVLEWALRLASSDKYKDGKVILLTHAYMNVKGDRPLKEDYNIGPANYGEDIWKKLVYPASNIVMVICGHAATGNPSSFGETVSFRTDKNKDGRNVAQMMFNAQTIAGGWHGNGGDGWIRILEFMPDGKTVKVRTFSPVFAYSPTTAQYAWRTEPCDQFDIVAE